ncbi:hypothetical protein BFX40_20470 [Mesorhizobium sp. SEMIA 3007]|nr:hypothetical protein BFX40_20470 [Mesorhizobium sp. SEMIA 3007]
MPTVFCLSENAEETLKLLSDMRRNVLRKAVEYVTRKKTKSLKAKPVSAYYDFATMDYISPTAALVLASIYNQAKSITGSKLHTVNEDAWKPEIRAALTSLGFHELLDMRKAKYSSQSSSSTFVIQKFTTGNQAVGEQVGKLQEALHNLLPDPLGEKLLDAEPYAGMFEAVLNSHSWAYPEGETWEYPPLKNWWLTGAVDLQAGRVTVIVYDQGVSIPVSLPHWRHWGKLEARVKRWMAAARITSDVADASNDGLAIRLAMTISKSQTNLQQHGKGLHTMIEVAQRARHGRLRILSRNGEYVWETGSRPKSATYRNAIRGTLVEWVLDL